MNIQAWILEETAMSREKLLLIDGHSIVNRAFYGLPDLTNSEGLHTNAILGFLNIFLKSYETFRPDYVVIAFDVRAKTFRHELFKEYKGTRKGMPEELNEQVPVLQDVLTAMGIKYSTLPGYEADDIIGTYARNARNDGLDVVILSGDRDLLQLASDETLVAIPKTKASGTEIENYYAKDVIEKYGVSPLEFIDMKALMGDSSDNIPGVPGIGEKTASRLIAQYGSVENAYAHIDEITPPGIQKKLRENIDLARLSRILAEINVNSPVEMDYHEGKIDSEEDLFNDNSYQIFKRLELKKLLERFDSERVSKNTGISYETGCAFPENVPEGCGIFISPCAGISAISCGGSVKVFDGIPDGLKDLLYSDVSVCCFGLKELLHTINAEDLRRDNIYDAEIMAYLIDPLSNGYSYDGIAKDHLGKIIPSKTDLLGKASIEDSLITNRNECLKIAACSAMTCEEAFPVLKEKLERTGMWKLFTDIEMPLVYSLYYMEKEGVQVSAASLRTLSVSLEEMAETLKNEIWDEAGEEFNINSPKQLGLILFEKLKLPAGKKTKSGYSTSADILEKLAPDHTIVSKILKYRQVTKLRSTYAEGLVPFIRSDGRIHGRFNQTITATGRISSTEPNLQNIPIRKELGQEIRKAFTAKEGCVFLDADYSQIELRLLAHLSDDKNLIEAYFSDADIHKITASKVFSTPLDEVTPEQRRNAKAVNFGIVYGISSFGLSQGLSITRAEAGEYIKQYFETYPQVKEYLDSTVNNAKNDGFVTTMFGRRRPVPELSSGNFMQRQFGERVAMNSPIQGSAADIMKLAMINVEKALIKGGFKAKIVLQIHDELLVETPLDEAEQVKELLRSEMKNAANISVPLEVEVGEGKDWFEAH